MATYPFQLTDKFGRVHDYLRISLTERCNLRCFYCMPEEGIVLRDKKEFMTSEELLKIARTFVQLGIKKIRLTGGEPTIKKDFSFLIQELAKLGVELAITTNGVIIHRFIDELKTAKVKAINVSMDSLNAEKFNTITRRNYFQQVYQNIQLLIQNGFCVKINVVLIKGINDDEILDFVQLTNELTVQVRFIEFMPFDGNKWDRKKTVTHAEIIEELNIKFGENSFKRISDKQHDTVKNYQLNGAKGTFGIISSVSNPFCDSCNRIRLTADGKLKNCLFSAHETDLLSTIRANEPIENLIIESVMHKKKYRAGLSSFEEVQKIKNRSMVAIGG